MKKSLFMSVLLLTAPLFADVKTGKAAPDFTLTDVNGKAQSLSSYKGKYVVLEWVNHGCPFVKKHYDSNNMQTLQKELTEKGVIWLSICSSAEGKQGHMTADEWNKTTADKMAAPTVVLLDENGKVGKKYGAKTTPHMYVINPDGNLIYQGAIDDKPTADKADVPGATNYVRQAVADAMAGKKVATAETKAYGCSVKY